MRDENLGKMYLSKAAVMRLLDMNRGTFDRFYKEVTSFPRNVEGPGAGKKRLRWLKEDVLAWLQLYWKTPTPPPPPP